MRRIRRILMGFLVCLVVVATLLAGSSFYMVRQPFPQTTGSLDVKGLEGEVQVLRDTFGIPHIYASTPHDLFLAQGYVHAQDRFWQMEFWRHISMGRLAEIAGEPLVESDTFIRTVGWNRIARKTLAYFQEQEPEAMGLLEAYSAGVNAYLDDNRDRLSLNVTILGLVNEPWEIEPWTPLHTVGWGVAMAGDLSGNGDSELNRVKLIQALGEERAAQLFPDYPTNRPTIMPGTGAATSDAPAQKPYVSEIDWQTIDTAVAGAIPENGFAIGADDFTGSNSWVIGGKYTATGLPLLANDPHLNIEMPSIWYQVGLHAPGWEVAGFSFPGVPGVVIGHNDRIAWGVTDIGPDVVDLYIERVNPDNPLQYQYQGKWRDMEVIQETIKVNGGTDIPLQVRVTQHGPIINDIVDERDSGGNLLSLRWVAAEEPIRLVRAIFDLNRAGNYDDFRAALRYWNVPAQNFVYADVEGNIAYQMPGQVPIRPKSDGLFPVPGWTDEYEWQGWIPYEKLPALLNPEQGYIVTANNAVTDSTFPYWIGRHWTSGNRAQRIHELLEERIAAEKITIADIRAIQLDAKSLVAESYLLLLSKLTPADPAAQVMLKQLQGWDGQLRQDSVAAAIWEIFYMHLARETLSDELGEQSDLYLGNGSDQRLVFHHLADDPDSPWWDDAGTPAPETREDILYRALAATVKWFHDNKGQDPERWQWGSIHTATFVSNPLGQSGVAPIEALVNRGPFPVDGGSGVINANASGWRTPGVVRSHVSMRMIVNMAEFEQSQAILPTGQSGHPFHPHYDDMIELWRTGQYHPMHWSRASVEAAAVERLTMRPYQ